MRWLINKTRVAGVGCLFHLKCLDSVNIQESVSGEFALRTCINGLKVLKHGPKILFS